MRLRISALLTLFLAQPFAVQANDYYYGLSLGSTTYEEPGFEFKLATLGGKLGYRFNNVLSAEVHAGLGGSDDANGVSMDMSYLSSVFVRADWSPVADGRIKLYVLGGFSAAELEFRTTATTASSTESGASYAVGMELYAGRDHGIYIQWGRYLDDTLRGAEFTLDNLSAGYIRYF